jgi:hypothetical protein
MIKLQNTNNYDDGSLNTFESNVTIFACKKDEDEDEDEAN